MNDHAKEALKRIRLLRKYAAESGYNTYGVEKKILSKLVANELLWVLEQLEFPFVDYSRTALAGVATEEVAK
jgi:hypothetical protein